MAILKLLVVLIFSISVVCSSVNLNETSVYIFSTYFVPAQPELFQIQPNKASTANSTGIAKR
jgi:hypothetical protein